MVDKAENDPRQPHRAAVPPGWPFTGSPNSTAISLRGIFKEGKPILYVARSKSDGTWQFLDGSDHPRVEDAWVVGLGEVLKHDPSVAAVANLPRGWVAWRESPTAPWERAPGPPGFVS